MDVVEVPSSGPRSAKPERVPRGGWRRPAVAGAVAFWSANFVISLTPIAATYRTAMSITYVPMLIQAAVGGLLLAGVVAAVLVRYPDRVPGTGPQLEGLAMLAVTTHQTGFVMAQVFFSAWLFPLGWLVLRCGFLPRVLGWLLLLDGVAVLVWFLQALLAPAYPAISYPSWAIGFAAEVGFALWLVIKGVRPGEPTD